MQGWVSAVLLLVFAVGTALGGGRLTHPTLEWPLIGLVVALPLWWSLIGGVPPAWSLLAFVAGTAALLAAEPRAAGLMVLTLVGTALGVRRLPDRPAVGFAAAVASLALFAGIRERLQLGTGQGLVDMAVAYSVGFGALITSRQRTRHLRETERLLANLAEEHRQLEAAHARLAEHARNVAELAASEERGRLAREIHDVLAHALTAIIVQAEAATVRLRTDPPAAADQIQSLAGLARGALQEARLSVAAIRANPGGAGVDVLRRLCDDAERWSGMGCTCTVHGPERPLPAPVAHAAYRILQEALTNARRHGLAEQVQVELAFDAAVLTLTVNDSGPRRDAATGTDGGAQTASGGGAAEAVQAPPDEQGRPAAGPDPVPGSGLRGMLERAEALGGTLEAGPAPGGRGFRVRARLPLPPAAPPEGAGPAEEGGTP